MTRLIDIVIFSFVIVTFVIGIHQTVTVGFMASYWLFMLSIGLLLLIRYRRAKNDR